MVNGNIFSKVLAFRGSIGDVGLQPTVKDFNDWQRFNTVARPCSKQLWQAYCYAVTVYECFTITLHFTFTGRQYDGTGNLQQWWSNASITNFKERADCMTNQYSSYTVEEAGKKVLNNIIFICDIIVHVLQYLQKKKIIIFFWSTIICCLFKTFEFYFFICYFTQNVLGIVTKQIFHMLKNIHFPLKTKPLLNI